MCTSTNYNEIVYKVQLENKMISAVIKLVGFVHESEITPIVVA